MKVTVEIRDYTNPAMPNIRVHNACYDGDFVELEINGERYKVNAQELISAIRRCEMGIGSNY